MNKYFEHLYDVKEVDGNAMTIAMDDKRRLVVTFEAADNDRPAGFCDTICLAVYSKHTGKMYEEKTPLKEVLGYYKAFEYCLNPLPGGSFIKWHGGLSDNEKCLLLNVVRNFYRIWA